MPEALDEATSARSMLAVHECAGKAACVGVSDIYLDCFFFNHVWAPMGLSIVLNPTNIHRRVWVAILTVAGAHALQSSQVCARKEYARRYEAPTSHGDERARREGHAVV